jgi:hypothetical protein
MAEKDQIGIDYEDIVYIKIDDLKPDPENPNEHDDDDIAELVDSLTNYKWTAPILVQKDLTIIDGHGRVIAAKQLGYTEVPCLVLSLSGNDARAYMIANKAIFNQGKWDLNKLPLVMKSIIKAGLNPEISGMHGDELDAATGKMKERLEKQAQTRVPNQCVCPGCHREFKIVEQKDKPGKGKNRANE